MITRRFGTARLASGLVLAATAVLAGCVGDIGDDGADANGPGTGPASCEDGGIYGAARPLGRLTPTQYVNTVRDLFGDAAFDSDLALGGEIITESEVRRLRDDAERIVGRNEAWTKPVFPCDITVDAGETCVNDFIGGFAARAYRRPLTDEERAHLMAVYATARASSMTFEESMQMLLQVVLQSPAFVYLFEAGEGDASATSRKLKSYEVASRLSYFLWDTMPDEALMAAAESGELDDPEGLQVHAKRLLDDPRAEQAVQRFVSSWLQLDGGVLHHPLEEVDKDAELYPQWNSELRAAMRVETEAFVRRAFFEQSGSLEELLSATYAYVNGPLADLYGVEGGPADADTWQWVELDGKQRGGILTRSAFLTVLSTKTVTAPIRRGVWVVEEMLCSELGPPPANANNVAVEGGLVDGEVRTVRQDVTIRTTQGECASCHNIINPIGFTFENYDAIGQWQTEEATTGLPVDASGAIQTSGDVDGPVVGAVELSQRLASSARVRECFAERWYKQAIGKDLGDLDTCALGDIQSGFAQGGSMKDLVLSIIASDAFRYLNVTEVSQ